MDYIVVGAGSAGGTLADRLSERGASVLLIEAGPDFPDELSSPPAFYVGGATHGERGAGSGSPSPQHDWGYASEPLPNGRRVTLARGKLVGGSSMANGCVAVRAKPSDFAAWGVEGWTWEQLEPLFALVERELSVKVYPRERWLPVQELFAQACLELGFAWAEDFNAPDAWGRVIGPWPRNRRNEVRQGSLNTYVRRARARETFAIRADTLVDRVLMAGGRAVGVRCLDAAGRPFDLHADHVVLAAGAYGSAPILLRSGIGPADELRALGIEPVADLPVGRGLLDPPGVAFRVAVDPPYAQMGWPTLAAASRGDSYWGIPLTLDQEAGLVAFGYFLNLTDEIEGRLSLASADPTAAPLIDHGYWAVAEGDAFGGVWKDFEALLGTAALRRAGARALDAGVDRREHLLRALGSGQHAAGGCALGTVLEPDLGVRGIERLSVADASVFPRHVTNNPNLTIHVVGEYAATLLAARAVSAGR